MLNAGLLDRRIKILRGARVDDGLQAKTATFAEVGCIWASRFDVSNSEAVAAGQVLAEVVTKFRIRSSDFSRTITPLDRVQCDGRVYNITGILELGRRDILELTTIARAD